MTPREIYRNAVEAVREVVEATKGDGITYFVGHNQPEGDCRRVEPLLTGKPVYHAVVWQCQRGAETCEDLKKRGYTDFIRERSGLLIDPYFAASGVKWDS